MSISVCMAVYNGQNYLEAQINSILTQLSDEDEVVIVDDFSSDNSVNIIQNYQDKRIKLIKNETNLGVVNTFEKALSHAGGNIIFLSDQDDIWLINKLDKFIDVFHNHPDVTLVISDAQIIDYSGNVINNSYFELRGRFVNGLVSNIIKNKYHGCVLAFRREMLDFILPFPIDTPMHDMWIGIVNSIYGKSFYLDQPLIQHRRHNNNTGRGIVNRAGIIQMLLWRLALVKNVINIINKYGLKKN